MKKGDPRRLAVWIIDRVFRTDSYADILLETYLLKSGFCKKDRAFTTELVYGTIRWLLYLDWILRENYTADWSKMPSILHRILEVGLYQILFLDRVPAFAAINESVNIAKEVMGWHWSGVVNGMLRNINKKTGKHIFPSLKEDPVRAISVQYSHPEWLVSRWIELWGIERTCQLCEADNRRPAIALRVNQLKTDPEQIIMKLDGMKLDAKPSELISIFITVDKGGGVLASPLFEQGYVTVQDVSAGFVGYLLDPKPGETILDMTAAPGGKSTLLAELCQDQCTIYAMDMHKKKLNKLVSNKARLGLNNIFCLRGNGLSLPCTSMDKVLVDAPCSGIGVLNKRAEMRWRRKPEDIPDLVKVQKKLLDSASEIVKTNGILVYSTCTILPEENTEVIDYFLHTHPNFKVENARQFVSEEVVSKSGFIETWPDKHGIDGSFAARLKKMK
jgi:16S rRNA (cytosine967-C5)-methyltransferase